MWWSCALSVSDTRRGEEKPCHVCPSLVSAEDRKKREGQSHEEGDGLRLQHWVGGLWLHPFFTLPLVGCWLHHT